MLKIQKSITMRYVKLIGLSRIFYWENLITVYNYIFALYFPYYLCTMHNEGKKEEEEKR